MKNYLARLGLPRKTAVSELTDALAYALDATSDIQSFRDAEIVLSEKVTRTYYERVHLQYEAINTALDCLKAPGAVDTHRWVERLVEFETVDDDPLR